jgi:hypothetical protein
MFSCLRKTCSRKIRRKETMWNEWMYKVSSFNVAQKQYWMDTPNVIAENNSQVILRIVPVKIRAKTTIVTYALCDEVLTTTLIDHQTAKCIGFEGTIVPFCCK